MRIYTFENIIPKLDSLTRFSCHMKVHYQFGIVFYQSMTDQLNLYNEIW